MEEDIKHIFAELQAEQKQREQQQGLGRSIISAFFKGERFVAVGNKIYHNKNWITFHDFLFDYIKNIFGSDWGKSELIKEPSQQHHVIQWYNLSREFRRNLPDQGAGVVQKPMTGGLAAFINLSYNLYLIAHNVKLQQELISRLKKKDSFLGAYYETFVAAAFIKAGFELEFENENDATTTHCEFTVKYNGTGKKYSVEAKAREAHKSNVKVGNQLHKALQKEARHTRIIFIDVNVPDSISDDETPGYLEDVLSNLRDKEKTMTINGRPAPPAYIFITNHPFQYYIDKPGFRISVLSEGYKIPDYKIDAVFSNLKDARKSRDKHLEMVKLMESIREHYEIPSTFHGDNPELAFTENISPLQIGQRYTIEDENGEEIEGELIDAVVTEKDKLAHCIYKLDSNYTLLYSHSLSDKEVAAYLRHPDTFFGVLKSTVKEIDSPLDLYDFFYKSYRNTPKKRLLELLNKHPERSKLEKRSQKALAEIYCEYMVHAAMRSSQQK
ncbi:hypothetical protein ACFL6G_04280 [candidate division KSB1 bacterium]